MKRTEKRIKEQAMARLLFVILVVLLATSLFIVSRVRADTIEEHLYVNGGETNTYSLESTGVNKHWTSGIRVQYNQEGSPPGNHLENILYANWSWGGRTGLQISYSGLTTLTGAQDGFITIQWVDAFRMYEITESFTAYGAASVRSYTGSGEILSSTIYLNSTLYPSQYPERVQLIYNHEIGHSLGIPHSQFQTDVMYPSGGKTYALSVRDVMGSGYVKDTCYVELTKEYDLYIPNAYGMSALLRYDGKDIWTLDEFVESNGRCSTVTINEGGSLKFTDVRGISLNLSYVYMEWYKEDSWKLIYAE